MTKYICAMLELGDYTLFAGIFGSIPASPTCAAALPEAWDKATAGLDHVIRALTMIASRDIMRTYEEKGFLIFEDGTAMTVALGTLAGFRRNFDAARTRPAPQPLPAPAAICSPDIARKTEIRGVIESVDINPLRVREAGQGVRALAPLISVQP